MATHYLDWSRRGNDAAWRYGLAISLTLLAWFLLPLPFIILATPLLQGTPWLELFLQLFPFLIGFVAILLIVELLMGRPAWSVAMPHRQDSLRPYGHGLVMGLLMTAVGALLLYPLVTMRFQGFEALLSVSVLSVAVTLLGLAIQTGFEELLFRGLMMQFMMRTIASAPLAIAVQALLFGAMHVANIAAWGGDLRGMLPYVLAGVAFGYAAWRTGSLLVPAALHFVNNASGSYLIGADGAVLKTVAPWMITAPTITQAIISGTINTVLTMIFIEAFINRSDNSKLMRTGA